MEGPKTEGALKSSPVDQTPELEASDHPCGRADLERDGLTSSQVAMMSASLPKP
jgi:hypothetical protein